MAKRITLAALLFLVAVIAIRMWRTDVTGKEADLSMKEGHKGKRVVLTPLGLKYYEDEQFLEFTVETASDGQGPFYYVYILSSARWEREMPEWCRHRRAEILAEILRLTEKRYRLKWIEMD
jgi:hypothetical protein